ncbi:MAG TPA: c-type cytochrome, partial [Hyphomicrobiaceae bacterium]|nr:c-type cytochrome [Hyphomicrobiaceae bacterium]
NYGAYLAEGLAHCGSCHSPRNRLGAEEKDHALAGGVAGTWHAPALNAQSPAPTPWTVDQLHTYLTTGFVARHGVAAGPMQEVVNNLRRVPESDSRAIAAYIGSILEPATAARSANEQRIEAELSKARSRLWQSAATGNASEAAGALIYGASCAQCHEPTGLRFSAKGIPLALSKVLALPDPRNLLHVIRDGISAPDGTPAAQMPGYRHALTEAQVVELASYLRARFTSQPPWTDLVQKARELDQGGSGPD